MQNHNGRFLREQALRDMGAAAVGENVAVHETCVLVALENMRFGSNVRIDPYAVLSAAGGRLTFGDFVHVGAHSSMAGGCGIEMADFSGLSAGCRVFSRSDDYGGRYLTNPTVPARFAEPADGKPVRIGRHVIVGAGSVILPGVEIGDGSSLGAGAVAAGDLSPGGVYAGTPAKFIKKRRDDILALEIKLREALESGDLELPVARL